MPVSKQSDGTNPYQAPVAEVADPESTNSRSLNEIARKTFLEWEKLRLFYVAALAVMTLLAGAINVSALLLSVEFWVMVAIGAVFANLCYFAGPMIESYVKWLGVRAPWLRAILFVVGTLFACGLAFAAIINHLISTTN